MKKIVFLVLILVSGCCYSADKEKKVFVEEKIYCDEYILEKLKEVGWEYSQTDLIFINKDNEKLFWNLSNNVFVYMQEEQIYLYIGQNEIFKNNDFENNYYNDLLIETNYLELEKMALELQKKFNKANCQLLGKDQTIWEKYQNKPVY